MATPRSQSSPNAQPGDLAMLVGIKHKVHVFRLMPGKVFQTYRGQIRHDDLIREPWGRIVKNHIGRTFHLLEPSLADLTNELPRRTQILYPKEIGFLLMAPGIEPGKRVGEAGAGSGAMTLALSTAVGPEGHIFSYEIHPDSIDLVQKNLEQFGTPERVTLKQHDIHEGLDAANLDAFFLDVSEPETLITQVRAALKPGGSFGFLVPTMNRVQRLVEALKDQAFAFIEAAELILRYYRADPNRLRPTDRLVAHTGYLVYARKVVPPGEDE